MFRVVWASSRRDYTRWFSRKEAAIRFYRTRKVAVVFNEAGDRIAL